MAYRSNTLRVRQPPIFIMTPSAIPARRRLRAAVRRRSWKRSPGTPADLQAFAHVSRKPPALAVVGVRPPLPAP